MGLWDEGIKFAVPGFLVALGAALAAPIVLPALARVARPVAKEAIRLYLDVAEDIREEVAAHHQPGRAKPAGMIPQLLSERTEALVTAGLETEAEESLAETIAEIAGEIL
jgi:hypothetical protein